jgi:hypothetical protein
MLSKTLSGLLFFLGIFSGENEKNNLKIKISDALTFLR